MARKAVVEARPALTRERIGRRGLRPHRARWPRCVYHALPGPRAGRVGHGRLQPLRLPGCHSCGRPSASHGVHGYRSGARRGLGRHAATHHASIYRLEMAHPELATIEVVPQTGENGLAEHTDKIVNLHLAQGMPEPVLTQAWALVDAYLTGFIGNAIAVRASRPSVDCGASGAQVAEGGSSAGCASSDTLPWQRVVAAAYTDEAFAHGVEIIIQGIRALAAPDPCEWRTPEP